MKKLMAALFFTLLTGCAGLPPDIVGPVMGGSGALSDSEISAGLKEALAVGTERAVSRIGRTDGFWQNLSLKVPLPESVQKIERPLRALGQGRLVDDFHLSLNRAAEQAVAQAAPVFGQAIREITLADVRNILYGPADAATNYFRGKTSAALTARFKPVVTRATDAVGATKRYKDLAARLGPYASGFRMQDLDTYITDLALAGTFKTLAEEEARIRADPVARTTELLRRVFGSR